MSKYQFEEVYFVIVVWNSLCRPAGLELKDPPASAPYVVQLKLWVPRVALFLNPVHGNLKANPFAF